MTRVIVTGTAGFIGSTLARTLADDGYEVIGSDTLSDDERWQNLDYAHVADFVEPTRLAGMIAEERLGPIAAVFHQGACSDTTNRDGTDMMHRNFHQPAALLSESAKRSIPFIYASSASVYGNNRETAEIPSNEAPINLYAYSKLQFDRYVRANVFGKVSSTVVGLRYFNVYGEREQYKGRMASVVHHFERQIREVGTVRLFDRSGGYEAGEQQRDFVCVDDVVAVNRHFGFTDQPTQGIFNVGTGTARSFNEMAQLIIGQLGGTVEYIPFPADLEGRYQYYTQADLSALHASGFPTSHHFLPIDVGVPRVANWLAGRDV